MLALAGMKGVIAAAAGLSGLAIAAFFGWHGLQDDIPRIAMHRVEVNGQSLLVAEREVTRRQWRVCAEAGACEDLTGPVKASEPDMPMTGVNHLDAEAYLAWLNAGHRRYRLPTAEEWNAIAADLPHKPYKKLFTDPRLAWAADYGTMEKVSAVVRPSGFFGTLPNGIADLGGNVWEWTSTCTKPGMDAAVCPAYRVEGLHETVLSVFVREPASGGCAVGAPPANVGIRLVSEE